MKTFLILTALTFAGFAPARAADDSSTSTATIESLSPQPKNEQVQKDIDKEITNAKMRADFGSRSRWSVKMAFEYTGSTIERPLDEIRPNYRRGLSGDELATLSGTVGARVALSPRDSLSMGTGVSMLTPLSGTRGTFEDPRYGIEMKRYQVSTPYLSYSRAYRAQTALGGLQMISAGTYYRMTSSDAVDGMGQTGAVSLMQTVANEFGTSGWTGGAQLMLYKFIYEGDVAPEYARVGVRQIDFVYLIAPFAEYALNDRVSFRTIFGWFSNSQVRGTTDGTVRSETPYQSVGLGISVTRDIYLYPNVQFLPLDVRADRTNVALSSTINLF